MMSRVVLASDSDEFEKLLAASFDHTLTDDIRRVSAEIPPLSLIEGLGDAVEVVAVGPGLALGAAVAMVQALDRERPDVSVVVVGYPSADLLEAALRAGARDVVAPDAPEAEVREVFERAMEASRRRRGRVELPGQQPTQRTISVISAKGGSGKTALASNLAVALSRLAPGRVAVADLDLQFGDLVYALGLQPEVTITDATRSSVPLDPTTVKAYLTRHQSDAFVLCAPVDPVTADTLPIDKVASILDNLQAEFPYLVLDTGAGIDEAGLVALDHSTDIVMIAGTDVASVRALQKTVVVLQQLQYTDRRWHFVLNRANARVGLSVPDIEATIGMKADIAVPSSRSLPISMNQGRALVETDPRSPVSRAVGELAAKFVPHQVQASRRGLFRRR
jgi:pilus assembly protein CpaE